jgi:uncharacterized protein YcgL (UPF0745 family)
MGAYVFNNQIFESWLTKMSDEILSKVNREKITTEEMIVLILKAQTNHFHHMDVEMKEDISSVRQDLKNELGSVKKEMESIRSELKHEVDSVHLELKSFKSEMKEDIHKLDAKMDSRFMWSIGTTITLSLGIYIKLFLG